MFDISFGVLIDIHCLKWFLIPLIIMQHAIAPSSLLLRGISSA